MLQHWQKTVELGGRTWQNFAVTWLEDYIKEPYFDRRCSSFPFLSLALDSRL